MYLISSFWCISIRKPSALQQQSKRTAFKQIKEHHLGRKKKNLTGTRSEWDFTGSELVPAPVCSASLCHLLLLDVRSCLDPIFSGFVFCQFSRPNGFTGDHRIAQVNTTGAAETPGSREIQGTATSSTSASPKTSFAQPQNPTLTSCIL